MNRSRTGPIPRTRSRPDRDTRDPAAAGPPKHVEHLVMDRVAAPPDATDPSPRDSPKEQEP